MERFIARHGLTKFRMNPHFPVNTLAAMRGAVAAGAAGLDAGRLMARAQEQVIKDKLVANTAAAHSAGAFGLPSFLVGDELFFGKDRLAEVEREIAER